MPKDVEYIGVPFGDRTLNEFGGEVPVILYLPLCFLSRFQT